MLTLIMVILGLAALYGFLVVLYYFATRKYLSTPLRWVGAIVGGAVMSGIMVLLVLLLIWPPVNILLIAASLGVITVISGVVLLNVNVARIDELAEMNKGVIVDELDDCNSTFDVNTRH